MYNVLQNVVADWMSWAAMSSAGTRIGFAVNRVSMPLRWTVIGEAVVVFAEATGLSLPRLRGAQRHGHLLGGNV